MPISKKRVKCLFLNEMHYDSFKFKQNILKKFELNEKLDKKLMIIPHYKIFIVSHHNNTSKLLIDDDTMIYIGSHNFTKSAWGNIAKDK